MTQNPPGFRVNVLVCCRVQEGRFGPNLSDRTMQRIEMVVEWVEARRTPFTQSEAWRGSRCGSWSTAVKTLLELRDHGLLRRVNDPRSKPGLWIRIDSPWPHQES